MLLNSEIQELIHYAPVAILICDPAGLIALANRHAEGLFGYQADELTGVSIENLLPKDWCEVYRTKRAFVSPEVSTQATVQKETFGRRKDGSQIPIEIGVSHSLSGDQRLLFITDMTRRKNAEEELQLFSRAVEQSIAAVVITNAHGVIEYVNSTFQRITGYTVEEVIGKMPSLSKSGTTPQEKYQELWQMITSGEEWRGELLNRKKNDELYWVSAAISPVKDASGVITHFLAIEEDITERKKIEEALRQKNEQVTAELELAGEVQRGFFTGRDASSGWLGVCLPLDAIARNIGRFL